MNFLFPNSKIKTKRQGQKYIEGNKNNKFYKNLLNSKSKCSQKDISKLYPTIKDYILYSPKHYSMKNTRNNIFFILFIYII